MKPLNIITHPYLLIASFLLILISGEQFGGFYALYLLLALPHGSTYALAAVVGIALLIYCRSTRKKERWMLSSLLNIVASALLFTSLLLFFENDTHGYNDGTFKQLVPQITLALFGIISILFIIYNLFPVFRKRIKQPT